MKILVIGFVGKNNIGDDQYKLSFQKLFKDHEFTFSPRITEELVNNHDMIMLGGGNILNEHYLGCLQPYKGKKRIVGFSLGGTDAYPEWMLDIFSEIYVRDYRTLKRINRKNCHYCPDAAFILSGDKRRGKEIIDKAMKAEGTEKKSKRIGIVINGHLGGYGQEGLGRDGFRFQTFAYDLGNVLDRLEVNGIFIPMMTKSPWDDRTGNGWVASRSKRWNKNLIIYDRLGVEDTLDIISSLDGLISTRLHSSIFSTISGVPFIDIWHHDKNLSFLETVGRLEWSMNYWDFSREGTYERINSLLKDNGGELKKRAEEQTKILTDIVNGIHFD